jgi:MoxR-like ATPase
MADFDLIGPLDRPEAQDEPGRKAQDEDRRRILQVRAARLVPFTEPQKEHAKDYIATPEMKTAVNVALSLGRPLLLTGEPGSGKTLAARWIALRLIGENRNYLEFQVRSDSRARDLRYEFDAVSWYRASQLAGAGTVVPKQEYIHARTLGTAFGWRNGQAAADWPYVVLIDEIDKAPRDFPNDLLLELDQMRFSIEETDEQVGPPVHRPIIVITSNAERRLPDPFLRRCIIHHIKLEEKTVIEILQKRLATFAAPNDLIRKAARFWVGLPTGLDRKPTIAEFWQWLALESQHGGRQPAEIANILAAGGSALAQLKYISTLFSNADLARVTA